MKDFDSYLQRAIRREPVDWSEHYVDYTMLKQQLRRYSQRRRELEARGTSEFDQKDLNLLLDLYSSSSHDLSIHDEGDQAAMYFRCKDAGSDEELALLTHDQIMKQISAKERQMFLVLLENQLNKATAFYSSQLALLWKVSETTTVAEGPHEFGQEILEVFSFMVANVISLRQILLRYDAFVRTYEGMPLSDWFLQKRIRTSDGRTNLLDLDPLFDIIASFLIELTSRDQAYKQQFTNQFQQFQYLLDKTFVSLKRSAGGHVVFRDQIIATLRRYFLAGSVFSSLSMEPGILIMRGRHLKHEMRSVARWREKTASADDEEKSSERQLDPENVLPLILNLISCFLFMMNNCIVEPSSAHFAEALGSNDAMSGIMIGAAPLFALLSAAVYSLWTNRSYKEPILFAASLMMVGNLLYSTAYSLKSMEICLIGRAITGLGAPRIINRRYVADATPFRLRTAASAAFAFATALGATFGPGMAIILDLFEFDFTLPFLGTQSFNGMTGPGFFMALMWATYAVVIIVTFREPSRSGLDELRMREQAAASGSSRRLLLIENQGDSASMEQANFSFDDAQSVDITIGSFYDVTSFDDEASKFDEDNETVRNTVGPLYCLRNMTGAVILCMSLIFMKRIALESIAGSTSVITKNRYGWKIKNAAVLHMIGGIIVIPVSILSGWLSQYYEDRYLSLWWLGVTLFGLCFMLDVTDLVSSDNDTYNEGHWLAVGPAKYIAGSIIAFSGIEASESFVASLMSKVVPSALAVGTFNSGLLTTLVGTSGRDVGDLIITLMGLLSIRNLLNLLIIPGMALVLVSIFLIRRHYEILAV